MGNAGVGLEVFTEVGKVHFLGSTVNDLGKHNY